MGGSPAQRLWDFGGNASERTHPQFCVQPLGPTNALTGGLGDVSQVAGVHRDQLGLIESKLDLVVNQIFERVTIIACVRDASFPSGQEPVADVRQHLGQQRLLAGKVPVDGRSRHS